MDIRAFGAIQIHSGKGVTKKSSSRSTDRRPAISDSPDEVNLAQRASNFAKDFVQVEDIKGLTGDLGSIDTPAHARQAAENISKYGP